MDDVSSNNSSQYHEGRSVSTDGSEAPSRTPSGSWGFRSNSFPRTSFSSDSSSSSGKSGPAGWAKSLQSWTSGSKDSQSPRGGGKSGFNFFNNIGFHKQTVVKIPVVEVPLETGSAPVSPSNDSGPLNTLRTGLMNSSRNAVKAVQTRARHMVSQNKRRYQEGGFDLDLSYITENIIAMGFPAGDMSSGFFGYVEGFYRNHMEEVIKFLETQHKGKYKVYNLCSERLYDAALFEGKVGCFPFDDHNCPPLQLISAFCESAYSWLKGDLENVVVVHCKAGMARTGLMISCLLLYLKFFPTAEESIAYYNQKRCIDGKGLILPSQLRYVKYFERVLRQFDGEMPKGRKCILRGIRLHRCPYWIRPAVTILDHNGVLFSSKKHPRTKDMLSEDIWFAAPRKGVMVFALPGERCIADLEGDFKVLFSDRQGDFYCWLNTNMMDSRQVLLTSDLDGFDKRRLPSPGFQVEVVILDHDAPLPTRSRSQNVPEQVTTTGTQGEPQSSSTQNSASRPSPAADASQTKADGKDGDKDNIFSDSDGENDRSGLRASAKHTSVPRDGGADVDGEAGPGVGSPNSSAFSMSSTIGDGLRSAMDRMGASPGGRASPPRPGNDPLTQDVGIKAPVPAGLSDNAERSNLFYPGVNEAGAVVEGQSLAPLRDPSTTEQSKGQTVEPSADIKHNVGKGGFNGDSKELPGGDQASRFDNPAPQSDFQATVASAADASVFTFGDDEDFESDEE